jgi:lipopolysaccharide transport system permease protein
MMALPVVMRVMVYAMPCVYPISMVPEKLVSFYFLNPAATLIQGIRWSLWGEVAPPFWSIGLATVLIIVGLFYGLIAFTRAERTMVDSL